MNYGLCTRTCHFTLVPSRKRGIMIYNRLLCDRIMWIMRKENRLINDFKWQDRDSICRHMNALATFNYAVYSTHLRGLRPHLADNDIYIYADEATVVLVCLDCCGNGAEQTYNESEVTGPFIYSEGKEPRVSMVWKLMQTVKQVKKCLKDQDKEIKVFGILLTEADIVNIVDLEEYWESKDIKVLDYFRRLKYRNIRVNDDADLPGNAYVNAILDDADGEFSDEHVETPTDLSQAEFDKMLTEFLFREYEKSHSDGDSDDESGADEEEADDDETDEEYSADEEASDEEDDDDLSDDSLSDDDDDDSSSPFIPDGTIEQNNNVQVEVEILRPIANPREELDKLVGCDDIKHRMDELVALTSYNKRMLELFPGSKQHAVSLHSIFLGRPGTGKTTVCKIFGSLMRQAGALTKGHVVVCDRGTFIGSLWGDEERVVRQVVEKAQGGVLMIDEAYLLDSHHPHDPGRAVLPLLMNILADETRRDIAIVLCGYKEPMMKMLDINQGLASRFPNKFEFKDFTVDELMEITRRRLKDYDLILTDQAWQKYRSLISQAYQARDSETWGNARFIANQLERIYIQHASRCVSQQPADKLSWRTIIPEDIVPIEVPKPKARIGF